MVVLVRSQPQLDDIVRYGKAEHAFKACVNVLASKPPWVPAANNGHAEDGSSDDVAQCLQRKICFFSHICITSGLFFSVKKGCAKPALCVGLFLALEDMNQSRSTDPRLVFHALLAVRRSRRRNNHVLPWRSPRGLDLVLSAFCRGGRCADLVKVLRLKWVVEDGGILLGVDNKDAVRLGVGLAGGSCRTCPDSMRMSSINGNFTRRFHAFHSIS
jgi:hypothetical protein